MKSTRISILPHEVGSAPSQSTQSPAGSGWWRYGALAIGIMLASVVLTIAAIGLRPPSPHWVESLYDRVDKSVVKVTGTGNGTGFVIATRSSQHLVLTNQHVLSNHPQHPDPGTKVQVTSKAGLSRPASLAAVSKDPDADLALLIVTDLDLEPLGSIRPFSEVRVGSKVVAIGHPLGLEFSVAEGIVSGKRNGLMVQTTAPLSPGNSGGPLVDPDGSILGVNTLGVKAEHGQLLSFAVRADLVFQPHEWTFHRDVSRLLERVSR